LAQIAENNELQNPSLDFEDSYENFHSGKFSLSFCLPPAGSISAGLFLDV